MKIFKLLIMLVLSAVVMSEKVYSHGFVGSTSIQLKTELMSIAWLGKISASKDEYTFLPCLHEHDVTKNLFESIERVGVSETDHVVTIILDDEEKTCINCAPLQPFYSTTRNAWVPAYQITPSDTLLCQYEKTIGVYDILWQPGVTKIYALQVKNAHTYFVTKHAVLAHNYAMVMQGVQALGWAIGTGYITIAGLEQATQTFIAELAAREAAKKAAQKTAEKVFVEAGKKVTGKILEVAATKAAVVTKQATGIVSSAAKATTTLKNVANIKQAAVSAHQAAAVVQGTATQAVGGITLGTVCNILLVAYTSYKLYGYLVEKYAYRCTYKKIAYNPSQLAEIIAITHRQVLEQRALQAQQEEERLLKERIQQQEAERMARQQEKEAQRLKQEEERARARQAQIEELFEEKNSIWNVITQAFVASAAALKDAESTYLTRDKHGDKKKKLKEQKKKKKGGGNRNNDDDPEDPKNTIGVIMWLGKRLKDTLEDMQKNLKLCPKNKKLLDFLPKPVKRENIQGNWYHPPTARGNVMGGKSPGPMYSQLEEIVENAVPIIEPSADKLHWLSTSRQILYRIMDSRNGHYHVHQAEGADLTAYAQKLLKETGLMCSKGKII